MHNPTFKCAHRSSIVTRFLHKAAFCQSEVIFKWVYSRLFVVRTSPKQQLSGLSLGLNQSIVQVRVSVRHLGSNAEPNIVTGSHDLHRNQKLPLMGRVFLQEENTCVFRQTFILLLIYSLLLFSHPSSSRLFKVLRLNTSRDSADVQGQWSMWDYKHTNTQRPKNTF